MMPEIKLENTGTYDHVPDNSQNLTNEPTEIMNTEVKTNNSMINEEVFSRENEPSEMNVNTKSTSNIVHEDVFSRQNDASDMEMKLNDDYDSELKKQHECYQCQKEFSTPSRLKRHISQVHEGVKAFHCEQCDKSFGLKDKLKRHMINVHKSILPPIKMENPWSVLSIYELQYYNCPACVFKGKT